MKDKEHALTIDRTQTMCNGCGGVIKEDSHKRPKASSWDRGTLKIRYDWHEFCWAEGIEVQV